VANLCQAGDATEHAAKETGQRGLNPVPGMADILLPHSARAEPGRVTASPVPTC
jgi:hypothetical protein